MKNKNKKKEKSKDNVISFPSSISKLERQIEAVLFAAVEPLDIETIEKRLQTNSNISKMLEKINKGNLSPEQCIEMAKDKKSSFKLMGFGHRVYKNYDPRAKVLKKCCDEIFNNLKIKDHPLFDIAMELERIALVDDYFVEKKLYPNVDFYSGIIYKAIGIPVKMFTVMFAMARTAGWVSQWKEMIEDPETKIGRPRQIYNGPTKRKFSSLSSRK